MLTCYRFSLYKGTSSMCWEVIRSRANHISPCHLIFFQLSVPHAIASAITRVAIHWCWTLHIILHAQDVTTNNWNHTGLPHIVQGYYWFWYFVYARNINIVQYQFWQKNSSGIYMFVGRRRCLGNIPVYHNELTHWPLGYVAEISLYVNLFSEFQWFMS